MTARVRTRTAGTGVAAGWQATARRLFSDYGLSIVCLVLFAITQVGSAVTGWMEFADEQASHGQSATVFGSQGYIWTFLEQTLQNWQSEFLALLVLITFTAFLVHRGSHHSPEGSEEIVHRIQAIERRVEGLVGARERAS